MDNPTGCGRSRPQGLRQHRIEKRQAWTIPVSSLSFLNKQSAWKGLNAITMIISERRLWNKTTIAVRYYISSLENNAEKIAKAIRSHWFRVRILYIVQGDVTFSVDLWCAASLREDDSRKRTR